MNNEKQATSRASWSEAKNPLKAEQRATSNEKQVTSSQQPVTSNKYPE
jgi:hypothetical protein